MKAWELTARARVETDAEGRIPFRLLRSEGNEHYHIRLDLDGPPELLDEISDVEYRLHPTFRRRLRTSDDRANNFAIDFWTWGQFDIGVTLRMKDGTTETIRYFLRFELPADEEGSYIDVS